MVYLFFVRVGLVICLTYTFRNNLGITLPVTGVFAICALHTRGILEEIPAKRTAHDVIKLLGDELVTLFLVHFFLLLANGSLSVEANVEWSTIF